MEVKHPVGALKIGLELMVLVLFLTMPFALIALVGMANSITLGLIIVAGIGTLLWGYTCYVAFWLFIS